MSEVDTNDLPVETEREPRNLLAVPVIKIERANQFPSSISSVKTYDSGYETFGLSETGKLIRIVQRKLLLKSA
jgi:hypothetical protein